MRRTQRRLFTVALVLALGAAGCFNPFDPRVSSQRAVSTPAPVPSSPTNAIRLFAWCWANRDPSLYSEIFTDDYRFIFSQNDSAGTPFRGTPWIREDELSSATHMFTGGLDRPAASSISITLDNTLVAQDDPRPGKNRKWHRSIRTNVNLTIKFEGDINQSVTGYALFFVVRGDSALIPPELADKGFKPDSTRWWIERWEDQTAGATGAPASLQPAGGSLSGRRATPNGFYLPSGPVTFGQLKASNL